MSLLSKSCIMCCTKVASHSIFSSLHISFFVELLQGATGVPIAFSVLILSVSCESHQRNICPFLFALFIHTLPSLHHATEPLLHALFEVREEAEEVFIITEKQRFMLQEKASFMETGCLDSIQGKTALFFRVWTNKLFCSVDSGYITWLVCIEYIFHRLFIFSKVQVGYDNSLMINELLLTREPRYKAYYTFTVMHSWPPRESNVRVKMEKMRASSMKIHKQNTYCKGKKGGEELRDLFMSSFKLHFCL